METKVFDNYGIEIVKRAARYFIRIDSGEMASRPIEAEISMEDAIHAQKSPQAAYDVIVKYDKKGLFRYI